MTTTNLRETIPWWKKRKNAEMMAAFVFLLPSLIGFSVFYVWPAINGVRISMTDWNMLAEPTYVGFENYTRLWNDRDFWNALKVTAWYVIYNIPIQTALALVIAILMDRFTRSSLVRGILLLPWLMPNVIVALLWLFMLDKNLGIVNVGMEAIGLDGLAWLGGGSTAWNEWLVSIFGIFTESPKNWIGPDLAIFSIAQINTWRHVGYTALLIFAGLQNIPEQLYEAAKIDGASEAQTFWRVTIPLLRPVIAFVLVTSIIGSFQIYDTVAITTQGGPVNFTEVINVLIFEQAFERFNMGYATAISVVLFLMLVIVSLAQMYLLRADEADV